LNELKAERVPLEERLAAFAGQVRRVGFWLWNPAHVWGAGLCKVCGRCRVLRPCPLVRMPCAVPCGVRGIGAISA